MTQPPVPNKDGQGSVPYSPLARGRRSSEYVGIDQATGMVLGPDGYFHPLEGDGQGNLNVTPRSTNDILEELLREVKALRLGLVMAENSVCEDIAPEDLPDANDAWE